MSNNADKNNEYPLEGLTILLADDEERLRTIVVMMIEELGGTVIAVRNCEQAIEIYEKQRAEIDIVMLDLRMGGIGGEGAFRKIIASDSSAKILLLSGVRPSDNLIDELHEYHCDFVEKPFDMEELALALTSLDKKKSK